jgi:hypothetical protein
MAIEALPPLERNYREKSLPAGSALTVENYTILPTSYDDYDDFSEHNCYGQSKSTYATVFPTVHELYVRDVRGERQCIRALIDCGATSLFMAPRLLRRLGLPSEPTHIPVGLDSLV